MEAPIKDFLLDADWELAAVGNMKFPFWYQLSFIIWIHIGNAGKISEHRIADELTGLLSIFSLWTDPLLNFECFIQQRWLCKETANRNQVIFTAFGYDRVGLILFSFSIRCERYFVYKLVALMIDLCWV